MPRLKKQTFSTHNKAGYTESIDVEIHVSADGQFYGYVPEYLLPSLDAKNIDLRGKAAGIKIVAATLDNLERVIKSALYKYATPEVIEEHVIRYNIESHCAFAFDDAGNIHPNGYFGENLKFSCDKSAFCGNLPYGDHHATSAAKGGFGLTVGAKAMTKTTTIYGDKRQVAYIPYHKGGSHLGHDNPANLLNSWHSFSLPDDAKEIPYSDEAALFFHSMMMGIAQLNKKVQEATFGVENLQRMIANHAASGNLLVDMTRN